MDRADPPADHDLDFYAHSAWLLREAGRQARDRLGLDNVRPALGELDDALPHLQDYRDVVTHALDDRLDNIVWFGLFAGRLLADGGVEYLVDTRDTHHEALERFYRAVDDALRPECSDPRPPA